MVGSLMAKKKDDATPYYKPPGGRSGTTTVRVNGDLGYMISWICEIEDLKQHQLLDPLLRPQITSRFSRIKDTVDRIEDLKLKGKPEPE